MKKTYFVLILFTLFSNSYSQNDSIREPIECGTGRIMQIINERNKKIIEDFIAASQKDPLFGNGRWKTIGKQTTDKEILKAGFLRYNLDWGYEDLVMSFEKGDFKYFLLLKNNIQSRIMALYNKTNFTFRTYDAFFYKNIYHREVIGTWKNDKVLDMKAFKETKLKPLSSNAENPKNHFGHFLQINEDYTFRLYFQADGHMGCDEQIEGKYSFSRKNEINFHCNTFKYVGALCEKRKKHPKPFSVEHIKFEKDGEKLMLKK